MTRRVEKNHYFIPHAGRAYAWIAHLQRRSRYVLSFVVCSLILILAFFVHSLIDTYMHAYRSAFQTSVNLYEKSQKAQDDIQVLRKKIALLQKQIDQNTVQSSESFHDDILFLLDTAQQQGLHVESYATGNITSTKYGLTQGVHLHLEGTIAQFHQLLQTLQYADHAIVSKKIECTQKNNRTYHFSCEFEFCGFTLTSI